MENKLQTIQISIINWSIMEELVYEAQIGSIEDFLALTYRFDKKVKYKKPTDKNWYYAKTMVKRLFKKELVGKSPKIKFTTANDLKKIEEQKQKIKEEARLKREQEELEWQKWKKENPEFTIEQIKSMSETELANRLVNLYCEEYYSSKTDYESYYGPFKSCLTEIAFIELLVSPGIADRAYIHAYESIFRSKHTGEVGRIPMSKIFRLTDEYELEYIGRAS
jgi:hypothetical protein